MAKLAYQPQPSRIAGAEAQPMRCLSADRNPMAVLRPKRRLIYFRVTEDEFQRVSELCRAEGARSISDLVRDALGSMHVGRRPDQEVVDMRLQNVESLVQQIGSDLRQMAALLQQHVDKQVSGTTHNEQSE